MTLPKFRILVLKRIVWFAFASVVAGAEAGEKPLVLTMNPPTEPDAPSTGLLEPPADLLAAHSGRNPALTAPVLPAFKKPSTDLSFSSDPSDQEIILSRCFDSPLQPTSGPGVAGENAALAEALLSSHRMSGNMAPIESFLSSFPNSRWKASLELNEALNYRHEARWTKVLPLLEDSWGIAKNETSDGARANADRTFGELVQMHARLGHYERLEALFLEAKDRDVRGAGTELATEAREGLWVMQHEPGEAFRCGPLALARIYGYTFPQRALPSELEGFQSTKAGTSLYEVNRWAERITLNYQAAFRNPGSEIIVPSVVHWKVGHFAALMPGSGDTFISRDATFRSDDAIKRDVIDSEASGYFLIPKGPLPNGWRPVTDEEAKTVFGKGDSSTCPPPPPYCSSIHAGGPGNCPNCNGSSSPSSDSGSAAENPDDSGAPGDDGGGGYAGMTSYSFEPASISLVLHDTPLGYRPPIGPAIQFSADYNHREASNQANVSNLGNKWTFNWLSYIQVSGGNAAVVWGPGGGQLTYGGYNSATGAFAPQLLNQDILVQNSPSNYVINHPDGSKDIYTLSDGSTAPKIFRTSSVDKAGNAITYLFDSNFRLVGVTDAIGQTTVIGYSQNAVPGTQAFFAIISVTDHFGRSATFDYNGSNQLTGITDVLGIASTFTYGSGDFITALTTPYGTTHFSHFDTTLNNGGKYGGLYRSLDSIDPLGGQERIEWDELLNPPFQDAVSTSFNFGTIDAPSGLNNNYQEFRNTFFWDKRAFMQASGNYNNAFIFHWLHDLASNNSQNGYVLESTKAPLENRVWRTYAGQADTEYEGVSGRPSSVSRILDDGTPQVYRYQYNLEGNTTQQIDPIGRTTNFQYDTNGLDLLAVTQQNGSNWDLIQSFTYNGSHLPVTAKDASQQLWQYAYNQYGEIQTITNPLNEVTTYSYDQNGYLSSITGPLPGAQTSFTHDNVGRIASVTDSEGYAVSFAYDAADRLTLITFPDGTTQQNIYNLLDLQWTKDRIGRWTLQMHDALRHLTAVQDPQLRTTFYEHCVCGALTAITDPAGRRTSFVRDLEERLTQKIFPDGSSISYNYANTISHLIARTDQIGQKKIYSYNADDTLRSLVYSNVTTSTPGISYVYDGTYPRITSLTDGIGVTTFSYNPVTGNPGTGMGQIASISGPLANSVQAFTYDAVGRVIGNSINGNSNASFWTYDSLGRLTSITNPLGQFSYGYMDQTKKINFVSYPSGQISTFDYYPNVAATAGNGDQRLRSIANKSTNGGNLSSFSYSYDTDGKITSLTKQLGTGSAVSGTFNYDSANQLINAMYLNPSTEAVQGFFFSYDPVGNRLQEQIDSSISSVTYSNTNEYTEQTGGGSMSFEGSVNEPATVAINGQSAVVDPTGNWIGTAPVQAGSQQLTLTATNQSGASLSKIITLNVGAPANRSLVYDLDGNLTNNGAGQSFTWDAENRLASITQSSGTSEFDYDGFGRRIRERSNGVITKQWIWVGLQLSEERDSLNNVTKRFYSQGEQIAGAPYYFTGDISGSIREMTDGSGAVRAEYDYDPFGRRASIAGDLTSDFGFTGTYFHSPTGLSLAPFRAYDPNMGRWLSRDPFGENGGLNFYAYVGNDPINRRDPLGLVAGVDDLTAVYVAGAVVVGVGAIYAVEHQQETALALQQTLAYIEARREALGEGLIKQLDSHIEMVNNACPTGSPDPNDPDQDPVNGWKKEIRAAIKNLKQVLKRAPNNSAKRAPVEQAIQRGEDALNEWGDDD